MPGVERMNVKGWRWKDGGEQMEGNLRRGNWEWMLRRGKGRCAEEGEGEWERNQCQACAVGSCANMMHNGGDRIICWWRGGHYQLWCPPTPRATHPVSSLHGSDRGEETHLLTACLLVSLPISLELLRLSEVLRKTPPPSPRPCTHIHIQIEFPW